MALTIGLSTLPVAAQERLQFDPHNGFARFPTGGALRLASQARTAAHRTSYLAQNQQQQAKKPGVRVSPPQSGVRLLEELFQRVRSAPQVAMAKNLKQQQEAQLSMNKSIADKLGPTDYNLAIRPKAAGKPALLPQPTVALLPHQTVIASAPTSLPGGAGGGGAVGGLYNASNGIGPQAQDAPVSAAAEAPQAAPAAPPVEQWMGNRQLASTERKGLWDQSIAWHPTTAGKERFNNNVYGDESSTSADDGLSTAQQQAGRSRSATTFYNAPREVQIMDNGVNLRGATRAKAAQAPAAYNAYQPPDLGTATGRLAGFASKLQQLQSSQNMDDLSRAVADQREMRDQKAAERTAYKKEAPPPPLAPMIAASTPAKRSSKMKASKLDRAEERFDKDAAANEEDAELEKSAGYRGMHANYYAGNNWRRNQLKVAMGEPGIAALPPNVVTGIPSVRLGISESQAAVALNSRGTTKHDVVDKWTVLSWQRSTQNNLTALQLYVRNGQLDAMRIFDPSLMAPDFGVSMGADLAQVKERFGEPAFILPEPGPGAGQNYIYPISQVGFQLSRPTPDSQPRVMSVLIFNVK
jgi:hypothetical protein